MSEQPSQQLLITSVRQQGREIRSFDLLPAGADTAHNVSFNPGQVAILGVANEEQAYFALASSPEDPELEILVKHTVGASAALFDLQEGDAVSLLGVTGPGFDLDAQRGHDLVFVAMGTGVAPLRSALRYALNRKEQLGSWWCSMACARLMTFAIAMRPKAGNRPESSCARLSRAPMVTIGRDRPVTSRRFWITCCLS